MPRAAPSFIVPARVVFVEELPKTGSGKIRKQGLTELAATRSTASARSSAAVYLGESGTQRPPRHRWQLMLCSLNFRVSTHGGDE
jgi:hypothetical protein